MQHNSRRRRAGGRGRGCKNRQDESMHLAHALAEQNALLLQSFAAQNAFLMQQCGFTPPLDYWPQASAFSAATSFVPGFGSDEQPSWYVDDLLGEGDPEGYDQTTQMIRNLPEMTRQDLLLVLDDNGFSKCYDFLYLPVDFTSQKAIGYSLINFTSRVLAERFVSEFPFFKGWPTEPGRVPHVIPTKCRGHKGRDANVQFYRSSPVMHPAVPDEFRPILLRDGRRTPFPAPEAKVHAPARVPQHVWRSWLRAAAGRADQAEGSDPEEGSRTTLMLRNVPSRLSRDALLEVFDEHGFGGGGYDFVYLPMDFATQASIGYAIVNFATADVADRFREEFRDFDRWPASAGASGGRCSRVVRVRDQAHMGRDTNVERYRNSPVMHRVVPDNFRPMLFGQKGQRLPFPKPTVKVPPPTRVPRGVWRAWLALRGGGAEAEKAKDTARMPSAPGLMPDEDMIFGGYDSLDEDAGCAAHVGAPLEPAFVMPSWMPGEAELMARNALLERKVAELEKKAQETAAGKKMR